MEWIVNNWYIIVALIVVAIAGIVMCVNFFKMPTSEQIKCAKEYLKWVVTECERELGSGTGALKLRKAYAMAVEVFPWISMVISFDVFSLWVDEALEWMRSQLEQNKAVETLVKG